MGFTVGAHAAAMRQPVTPGLANVSVARQSGPAELGLTVMIGHATLADWSVPKRRS